MNNNKSLTWKELACSNPTNDRFFHTSTVFSNYIVTYGGSSKKSNEYFAFQVLNLNKCSCEDFILEGDKPLNRSRHSACLVDSNQILFFGGYNGEEILNDTAIVTIKETIPLTLTYKKIETTGGDNLFRKNHSANIYKNKMYVFGGRFTLQFASCNELWSLDLENFNWQICKTIGKKPGSRAAHCSVVHKNSLYIFGGFSDLIQAGIKSCSLLSFEHMKWETFETQGMDFLPIYGTSSLIYKDDLYIFGGYYKSASNKNQMLTYNFENNYLCLSDCQGDYKSVIGGTVVNYRDNLVLWGGLQTEKESISEITSFQLGQTAVDWIFEGRSYTFANYMGPLFNSEQLSDVRFSLEGHEIPAHKLVLSTRCKYFSNLFKSGMKESNSLVIQIPNVKLETFQAFLRFLYQNKIELTVPLALDLYGVADEYMQTELQDFCEKYLSRNITLENLLTIIEIAEKFETNSLKDSALNFMVNNLEALKRSQVLNLLPLSANSKISHNYFGLRLDLLRYNFIRK